MRVERKQAGKAGLLNLIFALLFGWGLVNVITLMGTLANTQLDRSPPQIHYSQIVEKHINTSSKLPTSYFLVVTDWQVERGAQALLRVNYETFEAVEVSSPIIVTTRSGLLGAEWLVDIKLDEAGDD
jgi:hypothetical protein